MRVSLVLVEMMIWLFYLSKGFLGAKIKAELDIMKNKEHITSRYKELEGKKLVSDKELIKLFPDEIFVPKNVSGKVGSKTFNSILSVLSKKSKQSILF